MSFVLVLAALMVGGVFVFSFFFVFLPFFRFFAAGSVCGELRRFGF